MSKPSLKTSIIGVLVVVGGIVGFTAFAKFFSGLGKKTPPPVGGTEHEPEAPPES